MESQCLFNRQIYPAYKTPRHLQAGFAKWCLCAVHDLLVKCAKTEEKNALYRVLNTLPQQERIATTLFYISQYTHADIATFLDLSPDTINNRLRSARRLIKEGLSNMDHLKDQAPSRNNAFKNRISELTKPDAMNNPWVITGYLLAKDATVTLGVACSLANQTQVETRLKANPQSANTRDEQGASPLYHAVRSNQLKIVEILLKHGADPNQPEHNAPRGRALHEAAAKNNIDIVRMLLEAGANPNGDVDSSGNVLYICKVKHPNNCKDVQELLVSHGAYKPPYDLSDEEPD